jgi:CRP/FNR family transcriptional regulator, cyclic AMP receptor protein
MPITSISRGPEDAVLYKAGQKIFDVGESAEMMYMVVEGEVAIEFNGRVLQSVGPQDIFGEMALIDASPRSAAAVATTDCLLAGIDRRRFLALVEKNPDFALEVMQIMAERLRRETET